ncbi:MAG: hypothetical protein WC822_00715 [Candidatus Paceibacterota bacterium]|jgi:hypothetical protein
MNKITKIIKKISFATLLFLLFFSSVNASEMYDSISKESSMYKYNALESNISFESLSNNLGEILINKDELFIDITKKIQDITERQDFSSQQIENIINKIENSSELRTFLIGNKLGTLKFQLVQIKDQAYLFNALVLEVGDYVNKIKIDNQIKLLEKEQVKVESFILKQNTKFSLFGWFIKIF